MPKFFACCACDKRTNQNNRRTVQADTLERVSQFTNKEIEINSVICNRCRLACFKQRLDLPQQQIQSTPHVDIKSPRSISIQGLSSTPKGHSRCVICRKPHGHRNHLVTVPTNAQTQAFIDGGVFICSDSRCCSFHLLDGYFTTEALSSVKAIREFSEFSRTELNIFLHDIRKTLTNTNHGINFDMPSALSDNDYKNLTGISRQQFSEILPHLKSLRNNDSRSVRTCLAVFLVKLKTGLPNILLATLFSLSPHQIQRIIHAVKDELMEHFVPKHLGFQHVTHEEICSDHTTPVAKKLFSRMENQAIIVLDGTYIYIQKSSDYSFQRKSYSMHKGRPLVKLMMIVATDGYIVSAMGPYFANYRNNDAQITKQIVTCNKENIKDWLKPDDKLIVDRGFRDSVPFLTEEGFSVEMPAFLQKGKKQHSTEESNLSRLVTKVRWIVESVNGRIKQFKLLDKVVPNTLIPSIGSFVSIACALCNAFRPPIGNHDPATGELAEKMLERSRESNKLHQYLTEHDLLKKKRVFRKLDVADLNEFPRMDLEVIRDITLGVYQLKQAPLYTREHLDEAGNYDLLLYTEDEGLVQIQLQSRHTSSAKYNLWIKFLSSSEEPIQGWYCTCKVGARVVGCCAHIASVVWFLGWKRWQEDPTVKSRDVGQYVEDAGDLPCDDCCEE